MARAYIVVARNDVPDNLLQSLDLWPNTSHRNYVTTFCAHDFNAILNTIRRTI